MNINQRIDKPASFKLYPLKGIEVTDVTTGSGGTDFTSLTLRDTITGTQVQIQMRNYEMQVAATVQKKFEKKYVVSWLEGDIESKSKPMDKDAAEILRDAHESAIITELDVEVGT